MKSESQSARDDELDALVYAYLQQRNAGASHEAALGSSVASSPDRERELGESLEALKAAGLLAEDGTVTEDFPEEVGGYRLQRRLGAGGMGVVFLAVAPDGSPVALKLVRPEQLYFEGARARFERELESVRRLDHPGIAKVIASGEENGVPYLAQTWIPGVSLEMILKALRSKGPEELSLSHFHVGLEEHLPPEAGDASLASLSSAESWESAVLKLVRSVAEALDHAHSRGVLHRDVKPSNIMLTADGKAVLVDFGLAKLPNATSITRPGAQPGSLPYMPPEQIDTSSKESGTRGDIYSLGVTLYELLSLRQPFTGQSAGQVRSLVLEGHPLPLRKLNGQVSKDTEILCNQAMDPDPKRRYASAKDLADDITRKLTGKKILARPPGGMLRTIRWSKRRPLQAALLLFVIGVPSTWAILTQWTIREVQAAFQSEQEAHRVVDRHLEMTLGAIQSLFDELSSEEIEPSEHVHRTRLGAVDLALEVMGDLYRERPANDSVREKRGHLMGIRARALFGLGENNRARVVFEEQIAVLEGLVDDGPAERQLLYRRGLAIALVELADLTSSAWGGQDALRSQMSALFYLRELQAEDPTDAGHNTRLAGLLGRHAALLLDLGRTDEALESAEEGIQVLEAIERAEANSGGGSDELQRLRRLARERLGLDSEENAGTDTPAGIEFDHAAGE
jgi:eukaryotic-like serine/threonine-protein kinase